MGHEYLWNQSMSNSDFCSAFPAVFIDFWPGAETGALCPGHDAAGQQRTASWPSKAPKMADRRSQLEGSFGLFPAQFRAVFAMEKIAGSRSLTWNNRILSTLPGLFSEGAPKNGLIGNLNNDVVHLSSVQNLILVDDVPGSYTTQYLGDSVRNPPI